MNFQQDFTIERMETFDFITDGWRRESKDRRALIPPELMKHRLSQRAGPALPPGALLIMPSLAYADKCMDLEIIQDKYRNTLQS